MSGDVVRFGLIGTGMMGIEHVLNLRLQDDAQLVAAADPHEASRRRAHDAAGPDLALYEDPRAMLEREPLDAVIVATPNHTHAAVLEDVFARDLHVLVEKPLCTTLKDCRRVEEQAAAHRGVFMVGMEYRYMPPVTRLVEEVHAGSVGRLRMLAIREHRFPFLPKVGDWNRFARNTGGTLVEKCCHFFDLMRLIVRSEPLRVYASGAMDVNHRDERYDGETPDIIDNAFVIVDFADGARASLDLCMFAEASRNQEEIAATGDAGKVECFVPESRLVVGRRHPRSLRSEEVPVDAEVLRAGGHHGATWFEHRAFLDAVRRGGPAPVSAADGRRAVEMGVAGERSIVLGRPVELAELRPSFSAPARA